LAVTQSGETADTLNAVRYAREKGATILGITNVMGSTITQLAGIYVGQNSGPEIGVAATKTFTAQLMVLTKLAINLAEKRGTITQAKAQYLRRKLWAVPEVIRKVISNEEVKIKELAWKYRDRASFCFLGRGINFATALEGRLKLLEIAYVPSLAYPAGESKHGFIALVEEGYPVIFVAPNDETHSKIIGNIMEMKARGARIIAIIEMGDEKIKGLADDFIEIPSGIPDIMTPIVYVIPLQLFAYYSASARGYNPDTPRNLAKSVTVE
jgi:glucosamine--fructose-6-phosphate aminotransferase (isomerizing)